MDESRAAGRKISHYAIDSPLGHGGMGEVYLARDLSLGRTVAIKLLSPNVDSNFRARLLHEARLAARLQHPAIATLYEGGEFGDEAFIAMEYVRGETLRARLKRGRLSVREAIGVAANLLEGLGHAHAVGILHRDIKPENIMLQESGAAKLLDFGLAKPLDPQALPETLRLPVSRDSASLESGTPGMSRDAPTLDAPAATLLAFFTEPGHVVGTPGYMSPEQIRGEALTPASDLFALGAVLYESLAGRMAFAGDTRRERLEAVFRPGPPHLRGTKVPQELNRILDLALEREPSRRYTSAAQFLADLRALAAWRGTTSLSHAIAVLPFTNTSGAPEDDWIGGGLAEGLTRGLARVPEVSTIPAPKVAGVRAALVAAEQNPTPVDVGHRLACRWVLSGTYRRDSNHFRVTTHLAEIPIETVVHTHHFEGSADGILEAQEEIRRSLAEALRLEDRPKRGSAGAVDPKAYEFYVRGRDLAFRMDKGTLDQAIRVLERAIEIQPDFGDAIAFMARALALRHVFTADPSQLDAAARYAGRALDLDPQSVEGHFALGYVAMRRGDVEEGTRRLTKVMELDPSDFVAPYMVGASMGRVGRREEGIALLQGALRLNPSHGMAWLLLGWIHFELAHADEAIWCITQAVQVEGAGTVPAAGASGYLGECLRRLGRLGEAREACLSGLASTERTDHIYRDTFRGVCLCSLGRVALDQEDMPAAAAAYTQAMTHLRGRPGTSGGGHLMVQSLAGLGRALQDPRHLDEALELFERRNELSFVWLATCSDDFTLLDLAQCARALSRPEQALDLLRRAREAGLPDALDVES